MAGTTGPSTYSNISKVNFSNRPFLDPMSSTTIDQYTNGKLALRAICRYIGRHIWDDILVVEIGDKDGAVALGGYLH